VKKVAGDFFTAVPSGGDASIMKYLIHDWDDERAGVILRNIRTALEGKLHGKVILIEAVVTPGNEPDLSKLIDLEMMLLPGGRLPSASSPGGGNLTIVSHRVIPRHERRTSPRFRENPPLIRS
jgi:O-methyltransferase